MCYNKQNSHRGGEAVKQKNHVIRTILSVLLAAVLVFATDTVGTFGEITGAVLSVSAADTLTYEDFEYEVSSDNTVTITRYNGSATEVTVPNKINDLPVTAIGDSAFFFSFKYHLCDNTIRCNENRERGVFQLQKSCSHNDTRQCNVYRKICIFRL